MTDADLSSVAAGLLAKVTVKLEELHMRNARLTGQQLEAIFVALAAESKLKKLILKDTNLSSVNAGLMAKAVIKLEEVAMRYTEMTAQQFAAILSAITNNRGLRKLDVVGNHLIYSVESSLLARAYMNSDVRITST